MEPRTSRGSSSVFRLVPVILTMAGCEDTGSDPTTMAGACGMEGMRAECLVASDCQRYLQNDNWCSERGQCTHGFPGDFECFNIGDSCLHDGKVCGTNGLCTYTCATHADCLAEQYCHCSGDGSYCAWALCRDRSCPAGTHPDPGSLLCVPDARAGDCFGPNNTCPEGYTKIVGTGEPGLGSSACVADATSL